MPLYCRGGWESHRHTEVTTAYTDLSFGFSFLFLLTTAIIRATITSTRKRMTTITAATPARMVIGGPPLLPSAAGFLSLTVGLSVVPSVL